VIRRGICRHRSLGCSLLYCARGQTRYGGLRGEFVFERFFDRFEIGFVEFRALFDTVIGFSLLLLLETFQDEHPCVLDALEVCCLMFQAVAEPPALGALLDLDNLRRLFLRLISIHNGCSWALLQSALRRKEQDLQPERIVS